MSGEASDAEIDLEVVRTAAGDGGVPHGEAILAFVDAAMAVDPSLTAEARETLEEALGPAGVVDAAAVTAMFQLNTRAADCAGVPVEEPTAATRSQIGVELGFDERPDGIAP